MKNKLILGDKSTISSKEQGIVLTKNAKYKVVNKPN